MIKLTNLNILGSSNGILDLKEGFDKTLKYVSAVSRDLLRIAWKCINNLSNNLRLDETSILVFFRFYCKISRNQLEIVVEAKYGIHS